MSTVTEPYVKPTESALPERAVSRFDRTYLICPQLGCSRIHGHFGGCSNEVGRHAKHGKR